MTPEEVKQVQFHAQQRPKILYSDTAPASIQT